MSISPTNTLGDYLLSRYLPPIPKGIAANWIESRSLKGKFVLDPFGAAPDLSVQAAQSGVRLIVAANNPITRLLIEVAANSPNPAELRNILAALSAIRVRDERLETHISALYQTSCPNCATSIGVEAFIWEREADAPYARIIQCPNCETAGEFPATETDLQRASQFSSGGLHHSRALGRVAPLNDPDRVHVEEALNVYPPRAIYALLTVVNKLDLLNLSPTEEKYLAAILLSAFDQANTLWPHPVARERPRQLTIPPVYRENNLWLALENAAKRGPASTSPVAISYWPVLPPEGGGICLFEGPIRDLAAQLTKIELSAILTAFPRPNQAFWSLSALWAGWFWGHEAVEHFKTVLRRRRYDWGWHATAIQAALDNIKPALPDGMPILGLIGEAEPGFTGAISVAASQADYQLEHIDLWSDEKLAQFHWQITQQRKVSNQNISDIITSTAHDYLIERGEPSNYLQLHTAILEALGRGNSFPIDSSPAENYSQTQQEIQSVLDYRHGFLRFGGSEKSFDVGQWWLAEDSEANTPLADRTEIEVVQYLIRHPGCSLSELEIAVRSQFSGLPSPDAKLICECLESYGENTGAGWHLRDQDEPTKRRAELSMMEYAISGLGKKMGFSVQASEKEISKSIWNDPKGDGKYVFYFSASALLGKFLVNEQPAPERGIIVLPGGRANLVIFKLRRDPRLQKIFEQGWQFLKFRQARQLAQNPILTAETLEAQLGLDPLTYAETQMRMF